MYLDKSGQHSVSFNWNIRRVEILANIVGGTFYHFLPSKPAAATTAHFLSVSLNVVVEHPFSCVTVSFRQRNSHRI